MGRERIGYVLKKFPRLSETFILSELLGVQAAGIETTVFTHRPADNEPRHADLQDLRAEVVELAEKRSRVAEILEASGAARAELEALLVRVRGDGTGENPNKRGEGLIAQGAALAKEVRARKITHLHAHFMTVAARIAYVAHLLCGVRFTVTSHAKDIWRHDVDRELYAAVAARAHAVVTVCDANADFIRSQLLRSGRVVRIYNGLPEAVRTPPAVARDARLIVGVGRLVPKKGFDVLLGALQLLEQRGVPFRAIIVGNGEEHSALTQMAQRCGLDDLVNFTGALPREEVLRLLASARVAALPCLRCDDGNQDALPTVLLEALAFGTPVVSTPVAGIPEIADSGEHGLIVPQQDIPATANALQRLLSDDAFWQHCSERGPQRVAERFRQEQTLPQLTALFRGEVPGAVAGRESLKVLLLCADSGIAPDGTKGASLHLRAMARALQECGHEVQMLTRRAPAAGAMLGFPWAQLADASALGDQLAALKPDLIVERYSLGHTAALLAAAHARIPFALEVNAPLVIEARLHRAHTLHGGESEAEALLWREAPFVFAVSRPLLDHIRNVRGNADGLHLLRNGCDPALHPQPAAPAAGVPILAFLGHPKPWHGVGALVPLAQALQAAGVAAKLRIIGGGPGADAVLQAAAAAGVADWFSSSGALDEHAAAQELSAATLLLAPYPPSDFFWFSPLKLVQAAVAGVPAVTTDLGDIAEITGPGGVCVPAGDNAAFAAAVIALLQDRPRLAKLAADARQRGLAEFPWVHVAQRMLQATGLPTR